MARYGVRTTSNEPNCSKYEKQRTTKLPFPPLCHLGEHKFDSSTLRIELERFVEVSEKRINSTYISRKNRE